MCKGGKMKKFLVFGLLAIALTGCEYRACAERERNARSSIYFEADSTRPTPDSMARLDEGLVYLREHRFKKIKLEGWTDERGGENQSKVSLSRARAETIRDYMITNGIARNRIETTWHGINEGNPYEINRRVDVIIK